MGRAVVFLGEARREGEEDVEEGEGVPGGEEAAFLRKAWELLTLLIMQNPPTWMTIMVPVVTGTVLGAWNQTMGQDLITLGVRGQIIPETLTLLLVHGEQLQRNGVQRTGMKIFQRQRYLLLPVSPPFL